MEVGVRVHETIARPVSEVRAYLTDPANDPIWIGGIETARILDGDAVVVGARVERVARFLGRRIEYVNEVVALDDGQLAMKSVQAPFPMEVAYRFAGREGATDVTIDASGDVGRFFGLVRPLVQAMLRRNIRRDLARLKDILEA